MDSTFYQFHTPNSSQNNDQATMGDLWDGYAQSTTIHGVPGLVKSKGSLKKLVWTTVFIASLCGFLYNFYAITNTFFSYPVFVRVEKLHSREIIFPAITVCNSNPVKKSAIYNSPRLQSLLDGWGIDTSERKRRRKRSSSCNNIEPTTQTCYWLTSGTYTKSAGEAACQADGGDMAVLDTKTKSDYVQNNGIIPNAAWLDLTYTSNQWKWKGTTLVSWTNWMFGIAPSSSQSTSKPCVYFETAVSKVWFGSSCNGAFSGSSPLPALCETPYVTTTTTSTTTTTTSTTTPTTTTTTPITTTTTPTTTTTTPTTTTPTTTTTTTTTTPTIPTTTTTPTTTTIPTTTTPTITTTTSTTSTTAPTTTFTTPTITTPSTTTITSTTTTTTPTTTTTIATTTTPTTTTTTSMTSTSSLTTATTHTTTAVPTTTITTTTDTPTASIPGASIVESMYPDREPYREDYLQESDLITFMAGLPTNVKKDLGYDFPEFVISCAFQGQECFEKQFDYFFDAVHGNCYIFNSGWNDNINTFTTSHSGTRYGLQLVINIKQEEYISGIGNNAGAVVVVREQNTMPFPEDEGVFAPPGMATSIGLKKVKVSRRGGNYGNCTDDISNNVNNVFSEHYPVKYTVNACEKTCYQRHVIKSCGCGDPQYPLTGAAVGSNVTVPCNYRDQTQEDCVYGITLDYIQNKLACECDNPCTDDFYKYAVSRVLWPTEKGKQYILERLSKTVNSTSPEYLLDNLLKIDIYFDELNYENMQELPKYPLSRYISDIGATIGLWIGCSILTVLELLELIMDALVLVCIKCSRKLKENKTIKTDKEEYSQTYQKNRRLSPYFTGMPLKSLQNRRVSRVIVKP